jgi:diacylglycerol kinase family enzyme
VLTGTGVPLGILPLGTLNHFAQDLDIPSDIEGAVDVISAACARQVDVAEVNGHVFINNSSIGIYPFLVLNRERRRRNEGRAKWIATGLAVLENVAALSSRSASDLHRSR